MMAQSYKYFPRFATFLPKRYTLLLTWPNIWDILGLLADVGIQKTRGESHWLRFSRDSPHVVGF
jgi:hypothetical protein